MAEKHRWTYGRRLVAVGAFVTAVILLVMADDAQARRRRGPTPKQKEAQKEANQEKAEAQKALVKARAAKDKEVLKRFDLNKNGKIDGTESGPWDKYWREVKLGTVPHPYSTIQIEPEDKDDKGKKK